MATITMYPDPPILTIDKPPSKKKTKHEQLNCWELCITEQFPVVSYKEKLNETVICDIGSPHAGYILETTMHKNKFNGEAILRDPKEMKIAKFHFTNGIAMGKCTLYYPSGEVFFRGRLKDGYRDGYGVEYNRKGDKVYTGFYKQGVRNDHILQVENMTNCWAETNSKDEVIAIYHKNDKGEDHGLCAFYENENLYKISRYENGKELYPVYLINNNANTMEYYYEGVLKYKGNFKRVAPWCFWRQGLGEEYASDGTTVKYHGTFYKDRYQGIGSYYYKSGRESCFHQWHKGRPWCLLWALWSISFVSGFISYYIGDSTHDYDVRFICALTFFASIFVCCISSCLIGC